jgi:hypothetical protein
MRKVFLAGLVAAFATAAFAAPVLSNVTLERAPLDESVFGARDYLIFDNISSSTAWTNATTAGPGLMVGVEDYNLPTVASPILTEFQFVGGVAAAGQILWFDFYDDMGTYIDYAGVQFPQGGNYIWTITIGTPFAIPDGGYMSMTADSYYSSSTGTWFMTQDPPAVGTTDGLENYAFSLTVLPEPASLLLVALGGLFLRRR